jgi:hypothetical protein
MKIPPTNNLNHASIRSASLNNLKRSDPESTTDSEIGMKHLSAPLFDHAFLGSDPVVLEVTEDMLRNKQVFTANLLKHLQVGSADSLNVIKKVFEFHHYSTLLVDRYIKEPSQENLKALTIQIQDSLFLTES